MPLEDSFVFWNDKGGVGKTTLAFHVSTEYAIRHPNKKILVIDVCPRADVTMALLRVLDSNARTCRKILRGKSISLYLQHVTNLKPLSVPDPQDFVVKVSDFNLNIPKNVFLLPGDNVNLELMAPSLEQKRLKEISKDSIFSYNPWEYITSCVRYFIEGYGNMRGVATDDNNWVVFIDTNASFSIYTQMAIVAANRLIIPTNADDFSREAFFSTLLLVYGVTTSEGPEKFFLDETLTFSYKATVFNIRLPEICLIIQNRLTRYNGHPAKAYSLMAESISEAVVSIYERQRQLFQRPGRLSAGGVAECYCVDIEDFHTVGVVALHTGCPLANFGPSIREIPVLKGTVSLTQSQIDNYRKSLQDLVERLCSHSPFYCDCRGLGTHPIPFKQEQSSW